MMIDYSINPLEVFKSFWRNRDLIKKLIKREVLIRYQGSVVGILWSILNPIFMLSVYTIIFSVVFKARWNSSGESKFEFALVLFAGLLIFNFFSDCISKAPALILNNQNYVKKVVFPLEVLPWVVLGAALFHCLVSLGVWLTAYVLFFGLPHATILYLPLIFLPFIFFTIGLTWILSSLGVYLRDVSQFVNLLLMILMFLSPVFYPVSALPMDYQSMIYMNPLVFIIEQVRNVLYWGVGANFIGLAFYIFGSMIVAFVGFFWFQKTRSGFADVL